VSVWSTKTVRDRDLPPREKLVAYAAASFAPNLKGEEYAEESGEITASMTTIAKACGFKSRETASRIMKRLVKKGVLTVERKASWQQGRPTVYRIDYTMQTCDRAITGGQRRSSDQAVTGDTSKASSTCDFPGIEPVTYRATACDSPVTQKVEREEKGPGSCLFSQDQGKPKLREPGATPSQLRKAFRKTAEQRDLASNGVRRKTPSEIDARRRLLLDQGEKMKRKFAN
jgi:predicted transcriptional regulator